MRLGRSVFMLARACPDAAEGLCLHVCVFACVPRMVKIKVLGRNLFVLAARRVLSVLGKAEWRTAIHDSYVHLISCVYMID